MLNLYWKIFLAFWLTTFLIVVGAFWVSHQIPIQHNMREPLPPPKLAHIVRRGLHRGDAEALRNLAARLNKQHDIQLFHIKSSGNPFFDTEHPLSKADLERLLSTQRSPGVGSLSRGDRLFLGIKARGRHADGWVLANMPRPLGPLHRLFIESIALRLVIAFVLSGLICLLLARYFTVPIRRLREATHRIADGDYTVRTMTTGSPGWDELKLLARDFDDMADKVQQSQNDQARLIQDVSHELRSPLARLQAALGLLQQGELGDRSELRQIELEVQTLDELIEQILSLPRGDLQLEDAVDLVTLLQHCIGNVRQTSLATNRGTLDIEFTSNVDEAVVKTRGRLLNSVFENVLTNAACYSPQQGRISVQLNVSGSQASLEIRDQGPGVDDAQLEQLFMPFYRASESRSRDTGGQGLGLAIAERNVRLHHGQITANNLRNAAGDVDGFCIRIELPLAC